MQRRVVVHSLEGRTDLNGLEGMVVSGKDGRACVHLVCNGKEQMFSIKGKNLKPAVTTKPPDLESSDWKALQAITSLLNLNIAPEDDETHHRFR